MNNIPPSLVESFKNSQVTFFIGSGFSCNAGLPQWKELISYLKDSFLSNGKDADFFNQLAPTQKIQYLYDCQGNRTQIIRSIKDFFERNQTETQLHSKLLSFPVKQMITTNWDTLLEDEAKFQKDDLSVIWKDEQISSVKNGRVLIKMHGTIEDHTSIVFSEDEYYKFLCKKSLLKQYISTILATSTVVFIGYSFNDFDFKMIFNYVRDKLNHQGNPAYIFLPNSDKAIGKYLRKRGLIPIPYKNSKKDFHKATDDFLDDLSKLVSTSAVTAKDRLNIIKRENKYFLNKANDIILRNHSNIGPLGTPMAPKNKSMFSTKELTRLEVQAANLWREMIKNGARAFCMVCLDPYWIDQRYEKKEDIAERFSTFQEFYLNMSSSLTLVDTGIPTGNNINIYDKSVYLESKRIWYHEESYNKVIVHRDRPIVEQSISDFDTQFNQIKRANLKEAEDHGFIGNETEKLHQLILCKLEKILRIGKKYAN